MKTEQLSEYVDAYAWWVITALWFGAYYDTTNELYLVAALFSTIAATVKLNEHRSDS